MYFLLQYYVLQICKTQTGDQLLIISFSISFLALYLAAHTYVTCNPSNIYFSLHKLITYNSHKSSLIALISRLKPCLIHSHSHANSLHNQTQSLSQYLTSHSNRFTSAFIALLQFTF